MDSTGTRGGGCNLEASYGRANAGEGTFGTIGAGISPDE